MSALDTAAIDVDGVEGAGTANGEVVVAGAANGNGVRGMMMYRRGSMVTRMIQSWVAGSRTDAAVWRQVEVTSPLPALSPDPLCRIVYLAIECYYSVVPCLLGVGGACSSTSDPPW